MEITYRRLLLVTCFLGVIVPACSFIVHDNRVCFGCHDAGRDCGTLLVCKVGEECYTRRSVSANGTSYDLGCMSTAICPFLQTGPTASDMDCIQCCNEDLCNKNVCPENGTAASTTAMASATSPPTAAPTSATTTMQETTTRGTIFCYKCREVSNIHDCHHSENCSSDQVCNLEVVRKDDGSIHYNSRCARSYECPLTDRRRDSDPVEEGERIIDDDGGERSVDKRFEETICSECCNTDFCNKYICSDVVAGSTVGQSDTSPLATTRPATVAITTMKPTTTPQPTTSSTTTIPTTTTEMIPCVDKLNYCHTIASTVCFQDDHFTLDLCRKTCHACNLPKFTPATITVPLLDTTLISANIDAVTMASTTTPMTSTAVTTTMATATTPKPIPAQVEKECFYENHVSNYDGNQNTTSRGEACADWTSMAAVFGYTNSQFHEGSVAKARNFCRDPLQGGTLVCHTSTGVIHSCGIPQCPGSCHDRPEASCHVIASSACVDDHFARRICPRTCNRCGYGLILV